MELTRTGLLKLTPTHMKCLRTEGRKRVSDYRLVIKSGEYDVKRGTTTCKWLFNRNFSNLFSIIALY